MIIHALLALSITNSQPVIFSTYEDLGKSGYYFSPGYDCQITLNRNNILFSATHEENEFALFFKTDAPLNDSGSGYRVQKISKTWQAGQKLECTGISSNETGKIDAVVFDWIFDSDPGQEDHFSLVVAHDDERVRIVSCEWSYAKPSIQISSNGLIVKYTQIDGETVEVPAIRPDPDC